MQHAEDQDMLWTSLHGLAGRQRADTRAEHRGGERSDVPARQVGLRHDIVGSAAREQHGIPRVHPMDFVALTQEYRAAGDEVKLCAAFRSAEPKAERWRKLNAPILDASQTHADQKFIQRV